MKTVTLFSDATALKNVGPGGYGTILSYNNKERILRGGTFDTTANKMELLGVIEGLRMLKEPCEVEIVTKSIYVAKGIEVWLDRWIERGFTKVKNLELWQEYLMAAREHKIKVTRIQTNVGYEACEHCDQIAQEEAQRFNKQL